MKRQIYLFINRLFFFGFCSILLLASTLAVYSQRAETVLSGSPTGPGDSRYFEWLRDINLPKQDQIGKTQIDWAVVKDNILELVKSNKKLYELRQKKGFFQKFRINESSQSHKKTRWFTKVKFTASQW